MTVTVGVSVAAAGVGGIKTIKEEGGRVGGGRVVATREGIRTCEEGVEGIVRVLY